MSKRDNKRFNDMDRKGAPKRGGKNRLVFYDEKEMAGTKVKRENEEKKS